MSQTLVLLLAVRGACGGVRARDRSDPDSGRRRRRAGAAVGGRRAGRSGRGRDRRAAEPRGGGRAVSRVRGLGARRGCAICDGAAGRSRAAASRRRATAAPATASRLAAGCRRRSRCQVVIGAGTTAAGGGRSRRAARSGIFDVAAEADDDARRCSPDATVDAAGPCLGRALRDRRAGDRDGRDRRRAGVEVSRAAGVGPDDVRRRDAADGAAAVDRGDGRRSPPSIARATSPRRRRWRSRRRPRCRRSRSPRCWRTPAGPEPAQEYVELRNLGARARCRSPACASKTPRAATTCRPRRCAAGGYALVVPSALRRGAGPGSGAARRDAAACASTRASAPTASANGGEAVRLMQRQTRSCRATAAGSTCRRAAGRARRCTGSIQTACDARERLEPHAAAADAGRGPP